ncbi:AsmA-like C-terminal region-containing protein, partial [Neptunomonas phycophila]
APQIAGAVFIIDKLIGDKLEKVSTLTYQLNGPWAEPEVDTVVSEKEKQRNDPFRMDRNDK